MKKCNWCGKEYKAGMFSTGFCSKKCEIEGGDRGIKRTIPTSVYIIFIFIVIISTFIDRCNPESKEVKQKKSNENNYSKSNHKKIDTTTQINNSSENANMNESDIQENDDIQDNVIIEPSNDNTKSQYSDQKINLYENKEETTVRLLKNGKSVREIADSTGLSKQKIREIKRKIE